MLYFYSTNMLITITAISVVSGIPVDYLSLLFSLIQLLIKVEGETTMKNCFEKVLSGACGVEITQLYLTYRYSVIVWASLEGLNPSRSTRDL